MRYKTFAIFTTLFLIVAAVTMLVWQAQGQVNSGKLAWAEIAIFPIDAEDDALVPENFEVHLRELEESFSTEAIANRVANHFRGVVSAAVCKAEVASIDLTRSAQSNRVVVRMETANPLVGRVILHELLLRVKREFLERTSQLGTEQSDLLVLQMKQMEFQRRVSSVRRELDNILADRTSSSSSKLKVEALSNQLEQFTELDEAMKQQLELLERQGEGMTFLDPTFELKFVQSPTFDQVSYAQLEEYDVLQRRHQDLLRPLTLVMQKALISGTGFTVE